jgi:hypothetical protein
MKRVKLTRRGSKRLFTATAQNVRPQNSRAVPMRGGFRL